MGVLALSAVLCLFAATAQAQSQSWQPRQRTLSALRQQQGHTNSAPRQRALRGQEHSGLLGLALPGRHKVAMQRQAGAMGARGASFLSLRSALHSEGLQPKTLGWLKEALRRTAQRVARFAGGTPSDSPWAGWGRSSAVAAVSRGSTVNASGVANVPVLGTAASTGFYAAIMAVGTPAQELEFLVDTGSFTMWTICNLRNDKVPRPKDALYFYPGQSSTYSPLACSSPECAFLQAANTSFSHCPPGTMCPARVVYADGTDVAGFALTDTLSLPALGGAAPIQATTAFACMTLAVNSSTQGTVAGLVGLGRTQDSMLAQLSTQGATDNVFSLCLSGGDPKGSHMVLGRGPTPPNLNTVPLDLQPAQTQPGSPFGAFYYLPLQGIRVGSVSVLGSETLVFNSTSGRGGTILDSGSTFPSLPPFILLALAQEVSVQSGLLFEYTPLFQDGSGLFCHVSNTKVSLSTFPEVFLDLGPAVPLWAVPPQSYLLSFTDLLGESYVCIAASSISVPVAIIGASWIVDNFIVFDNDKNVIQWAPYSCSSASAQLSAHVSDLAAGPPAPPLSVSCQQTATWQAEGFVYSHHDCTAINTGSVPVGNVKLSCINFRPSAQWNINSDCTLPSAMVLSVGQVWSFGYQTASGPADITVGSYSAAKPSVSVLPTTRRTSQTLGSLPLPLSISCGTFGLPYSLGSKFVNQFSCTVKNSGLATVSGVKLACRNFKPFSGLWNIDRSCSLTTDTIAPGQSWSFGFQTVESSCSFGIRSYSIL